MLDAVPTAHTIQGVGQLVVGVTLTAPDVGGSQAMQQTYFTVHGLGAAQTSLMMDGMIINGLQGDGAIQTYTNDAGNQEMVYQTGGGTVDSPTGGVKINMIPREGGNRISGSLFQGYESSNLQANNLTPYLAANGVKTVDKIGTYNDTNGTIGGPIMKDKLWYFGSIRFFIVNKPIANTYVSDGTQSGSPTSIQACANALAGRGGTLCPQGTDPQHQYSGLVRLTWQMSAEEQAVGLLRPHSQGRAARPWRPATTRRLRRWCGTRRSTRRTRSSTPRRSRANCWSRAASRATSSATTTCISPESSSRTAAPPGTRTRVTSWTRRLPPTQRRGPEYGSYPDRYNLQGSASYITGSQAIKVGFQDSFGPYNQSLRANADLYQNYVTNALGVPTPSTVTLLATSPLTVWQDD